MFDGQTIKTKNMAQALKEQVGMENVFCIDTYGGKKALLKVVFKIISAFKKSEDIIMLPAQNGVLVFTPILSFVNKFAKKKLHYAVIGGWLGTFLEQHGFTEKLLKKNFRGIYVETSCMKEELERKGFANIYVLPNYKNMPVVSKEDLKKAEEYPIKVCTFSRITEKKGVEEAVNAVCEINNEAGKTIFELDIYGSVEENYREKFEYLTEKSPEYIKYKGEVEYTTTVQALKKYDLQLFPTKFKTEGIPGSVVESFFAGTPVIASRWNSFGDVIEDEITGIGFEFGSFADFKDKLCKISKDFEKINQMKENCLVAAETYKKESVESINKYFV